MRYYLRVLSYFRDDLPLIIASLLLIGLSTLANVLQPFLLAIMVDSIFAATPSTHWVHRAFAVLTRHLGIAPDQKLREILVLAALAVLLRFGQEALSMAQRIISARVGYNGLMRVRCDLFRKLQELSLGYHKSQPQGDAIYRLSYDATGFQTVLTVLLNSVLVSGITLIFMTWLMLQMNWRLTLITLSVAPLLMTLTRLFAGPLKRRWLETKEVDSALTTVIQRNVASIGLVQAFGREADEFDRFHSTIQRSIRAGIRQQWNDSFYWLLVGTVFGLGYAAIFAYGGWVVICNPAGLSVGSLLVFLAYVNQVYGPLQAITGSGANIQGGIAGVERVFEVLNREAAIKDAPGAEALPRQPRLLSLENVGFEYRPGEPVLREITASIKPGDMVAFVGSSGVGKTTLLNLLPRFYDPTAGALKLNGIDIRQVRLGDLRKHVALVLQDSLTLPTTIAENIAYGRPKASAGDIAAAAKLAGADVFIEKLPKGYDSEISESGSNLSGGQRQRISIARALLTEAPILVLDEPTSALDPQHEAMIVQTLQHLKRRRTVIIVSHRLSTVADCDQILVMDEGRIVERGTHAQLLAQRGVYFAMAKHQLKLEEPKT